MRVMSERGTLMTREARDLHGTDRHRKTLNDWQQ